MREDSPDTKVLDGEILMLSSGSYSDYSVQVIVQAVKDFDVQEVRDEMAAPAKVKARLLGGDESIERRDFVRWLVDSGYVKTVEAKELWTGNWTLQEDLSVSRVNTSDQKCSGCGNYLRYWEPWIHSPRPEFPDEGMKVWCRLCAPKDGVADE